MVKLISLVYLLVAVSMPLQLLWHTGWQTAMLSDFWQWLSPLNRICLFCAAAGAVGAFRVERWGWFAVQLAGIMICLNNAVHVFIPLSTSPALAIVSMAGILVLNLKLFDARLVLLYFDPRWQWWKTPHRYRTNQCIDIMTRSGKYVPAILRNISRTGALCVTEKELPIGTRLTVRMPIRSAHQNILAQAEIVRFATELPDRQAGIGIRFLDLGTRDWQALQGSYACS
jgi:hypothetical protein